MSERISPALRRLVERRATGVKAVVAHREIVVAAQLRSQVPVVAHPGRVIAAHGHVVRVTRLEHLHRAAAAGIREHGDRGDGRGARPVQLRPHRAADRGPFGRQRLLPGRRRRNPPPCRNPFLPAPRRAPRGGGGGPPPLHPPPWGRGLSAKRPTGCLGPGRKEARFWADSLPATGSQVKATSCRSDSFPGSL